LYEEEKQRNHSTTITFNLSEYITMSANKELTQEQIDEINHSFHELDKNQNGYVNKSEIKERMKKTHLEDLDVIVDHYLRKMDQNADEQVSYDEYLKFMTAIYLGEHKNLRKK
ncbi:unnamed protein product, partial [Rotaria sordida]